MGSRFDRTVVAPVVETVSESLKPSSETPVLVEEATLVSGDNSGPTPTLNNDTTVNGATKKATWAEKVTKSAIGMELYKDNNPYDVVVIEVDDITSELAYWEHTLVGQFSGGKPTIAQVKEFVSKNWNQVSKPEVLYYKKGWFYFRFNKQEDMQQILRGSSWNLGGHSLILKQWTPNFPTELDKISKVLVWIILPDLDPQFWSSKALSKIACKIGTPLYADPVTTNKERLTFARIMVEVDLAKPLPDFVGLQTPFMGQFMQQVIYEWLPYYCTHCKKLGHEQKVCKLIKKKEAVKEKPGPTEQLQPTTTSEIPPTVIDVEIVDELTLGGGTVDPGTGGGCQPAPVVNSSSPLVATDRASLDHHESGVDYSHALPISSGTPSHEQVTDGQGELEQQSQHPIPVSPNRFGLLDNQGAMGNVTLVQMSIVEFWEKQVNCSLPWLVLGDINCVRSTKERISSNPPNVVAMDNFNDAIANSGLVELKTIGCFFTWTNKQELEDRKWIKLDRALVNNTWLQLYPDSFADALTPGISDHSPLVISLDQTVQHRPASFKFLNCWSQDEKFMPMITQEWETRISGCKM
ncbi:uncharacterized protein LOC141640934 [Silene latifolia]|uniref:uncharacterized protein LOC141640934 n=1 Tax=Silene latifolia TaxID=37657 RepID=UPI003D76C2EB